MLIMLKTKILLISEAGIILFLIFLLIFVKKPNIFQSENSTNTSLLSFNKKNLSISQSEKIIKIFLVALNDKGKNGEKIGCGDSLVSINLYVQTMTPLSKAIETLLSMKESADQQSGLYNSLTQSDLKLKNATIVNGNAVVELNGNLKLGGVCDNPRIEAQLTKTIMQFPTIKEVAITINGIPLKQVLSLK
jgi:hypothetical protein